MSLLWMPFRIIFRVNIRIDYAGCWPGVVWRSVPHAIQQFHTAQLVERDAAPVGRRPRRLQPAFTLPAVLIAKYPKLPVFVPPQTVRTEQARQVVVFTRNRTATFHGLAHNPVNILPKPRTACSRNAGHSFRLLAGQH